MQQCQIHDDSLKFSRAVYGLLVLLGFILHNEWVILVTAILVLLGAFSFSLNLFYQVHVQIIKRLAGSKVLPIQKESGELKFVGAMTGILLLVGFFWIYSGKSVDIAWIYILVVDLLIFLACLVGFCIATIMYVLLKKVFNKQ